MDELRVSDTALKRADLLVQFPYQELPTTITAKVEITFPTYRYNFYHVEWTQDLNGGVWESLEPAVMNRTGFPMTVTDTDGFGKQRFYRIREYN